MGEGRDAGVWTPVQPLRPQPPTLARCIHSLRWFGTIFGEPGFACYAILNGQPCEGGKLAPQAQRRAPIDLKKAPAVLACRD